MSRATRRCRACASTCRCYPAHVFTVEPGIYFVPVLLEDRDLRERNRDAVDWERAEAMLGFGGIRIENNVLITDDGNEVLTADVPLLASASSG